MSQEDVYLQELIQPSIVYAVQRGEKIAREGELPTAELSY